MAEDDAWFWVLTLGVAVLAGGAAGLRSLRISRLIEDAPTSRIRSAAQGYVELCGSARPLDGTRNPAPLTQRPCVWWRYRISKRQESGSGANRRERWSTVASASSGVPFLLDDGTGECIVQPQGAEIVPTESTTWYGDTPWPAGRPGEGGRFGAQREYRYLEERIYEHEKLYALGGFRSITAADRDLETPERVAALLADWKQDQPALIERFDTDRDGRLSLDEWERARAAAREHVQRQAAERPATTARHVLGRPDGDGLFLLAALPPGDLAKRYRRRAAWAFAGFVVGVYAFGWLLQELLR